MNLIAYFSVTGNTKKVAETLNELIEAEIFEIKTKIDYPQRYEDLIEFGKNEWRNDLRPEIEGQVDISKIDNIFLLYPNWFGTIPRAVATFIESYDLSNKVIQPIVTSGGGGLANSLDEIQKLSGATVKDGISITSTDIASCKKILENNI